MADEQKPEEPSKFQWLKSYWKGDDDAAENAAPEQPRLTKPKRPFHFVLPSRAQLKYLPEEFNAKELRILQVAWTVVMVCVVVLGVRFYQRHSAYVAKNGGSYTEALIGAPKYINPVLAYANDVDLDLTQVLYSSLFQTGANGELEPQLAKSFTISQDGTVYTVTLRDNVQWHDGQPLTAQDVAFTFDRILDPQTQSPYYKIFKGVAVAAVDDHTVTFTLPKAYAPFLSTLTIGILPQHIWGDIPSANTSLTEYNLKPIGSGPYAFSQLTKDRLGNIKSYKLVRFKGYFGDRPHLDSIDFRFYPTKDDADQAVKEKQAQGISFVRIDQKKESTDNGVAVRSLKLPQYTAVFFNAKNVLLKEKAVRQALEHATSKSDVIAEALEGNGEEIYSPVLPGLIGFNEGVKGLAYDQTESKKQFDEAGWTWTAGDASRKKGGKELHFALATIDRPEYVKTANLLKQQWAAVGVTVDVHLYSSSDIIAKVIKPRDYDALLFGEIVGTDPDPYPFWHSSQIADPGLNLSLYVNKDADKLLEEARTSTDANVRTADYKRFQEILAGDEPAIFLYNPYYLYGLSAKIKGFDLQRITAPSDRLNDIEHWYTRTRHTWK